MNERKSFHIAESSFYRQRVLRAERVSQARGSCPSLSVAGASMRSEQLVCNAIHSGTGSGYAPSRCRPALRECPSTPLRAVAGSRSVSAACRLPELLYTPLPCYVNHASSRRPLSYGNAVLSACCISTRGGSAMPDVHGVHSAHNRTSEATSIYPGTGHGTWR